MSRFITRSVKDGTADRMAGEWIVHLRESGRSIKDYLRTTRMLRDSF